MDTHNQVLHLCSENTSRLEMQMNFDFVVISSLFFLRRKLTSHSNLRSSFCIPIGRVLVLGECASRSILKESHMSIKPWISGRKSNILQYLEEKYPQKALLPRDPRLKARNLQAASIIRSSIQPLQMLNVLKYIEEKAGPEERLSWAQNVIERGFQALEKLLGNVATRYATGDEVCLADVFLAPQIAASTLRFRIDMAKFPTLRRIHESYKTLPEYEASLPESQPDAT